jgi:hypothetical protein
MHLMPYYRAKVVSVLTDSIEVVERRLVALVHRDVLNEARDGCITSILFHFVNCLLYDERGMSAHGAADQEPLASSDRPDATTEVL